MPMTVAAYTVNNYYVKYLSPATKQAFLKKSYAPISTQDLVISCLIQTTLRRPSRKSLLPS